MIIYDKAEYVNSVQIRNKFFDWARSILINITFFSFAVIAGIIYLPLYCLNQAYARKSALYNYSRFTVQMLRWFGVKVRIKSHILDEVAPVLVVSNHTHALDPALLYSCVGMNATTFIVRPMLAAKLIPYLSHYIVVQRDGADLHFLREVGQVIKNGDSVSIFPEGTRVAYNEVKSYSRSIALIARKFKVPVALLGTNLGYVASNKFHFGMLNFDKIMAAEFIEMGTYEQILFHAIFSKHNKESTEELQFTYLELCDVCHYISWSLYREDSNNVFARIAQALRELISLDEDSKAQEVTQDKFDDLIRSMTNYMSDSTGALLKQKLKKGLIVQKQIAGLNNVTKDTLFTEYVERTIRARVAAMD